jgi:hypothetical protein
LATRGGCRQLQNRGGAGAESEAARPHTAAELQRLEARVEEDQIEGESHPKGVDGEAARNQQTRPNVAALHIGEAEKAGPEPGRDRDLTS